MHERDYTAATLAGLALIAAAAVIFQASRNDVRERPRIAREDYRPDLTKCPEDIELWDCIKDAEYLDGDKQ